MVTKLQQTEQGVVVLLPAEVLSALGLEDDAEVSIIVDAGQSQIIITPATASLPDIDPAFAQQVSDFIDRYRPALDALAQ